MNTEEELKDFIKAKEGDDSDEFKKTVECVKNAILIDVINKQLKDDEPVIEPDVGSVKRKRISSDELDIEEPESKKKSKE